MEEWHSRLKNDEPLVSGQYICTCISKIPSNNSYHKYFRVMEFDVKKKYWHDIGNNYGISHVILAWKNEDVFGKEINDDEYKKLMWG